MNWGAFRTRYEGWSKGPALVLLGSLLVLIAFLSWSPENAPAPRTRTSPAQQSDLQLYRDIIAGVAQGGDYYEVAAEELRRGNYPLKPFITFRLPTHAIAYATVGERVMVVVSWALCAGLLLAWWVRLKPHLPIPLLALSMFLLAGGLGGLLQPQTGLFHESWAGLLLALMVALHRLGRIWPAVVLGGAALMIRELALPMILAMGGLALIERQWREAAAWALVVALFGICMTLHAQWVTEVVRPGDLASPGWSRMHGTQFALKSIARVTFGFRVPELLALALLTLSLFGWVSVRTGWALRASLLLAGYGAMLAIFARTDTFYWALIPAPLAFVGLAFLPKALSDLAKAARQTPYPAS